MEATEGCRLLEKGITFSGRDVARSVGSGHNSAQSADRPLGYHLKTAFLFTRSDFKTVVFPQSIFAIAAVSSTAKLTMSDLDGERPVNMLDMASRVPHMLAWIWLNLLVEVIANQRLAGSIVEDTVNKPWRPMPSKRLTPDEAKSWLLAAVVAAVGSSYFLGSYTASVTLITFVWMYNDLDGGNSSIWVRNALNAAGLMCFSWGALAALSGCDLLPRAYTWILLLGVVIMTTVHAQDLPDVEGDMARGRSTIPLLYGDAAARISLATMVMFWSAACPAFWDASQWGWAGSLGIGGLMSGLALRRRGQEWDEVVWKLWCLWMAVLYLLPALGS